jgi:hypothetical protein
VVRALQAALAVDAALRKRCGQESSKTRHSPAPRSYQATTLVTAFPGRPGRGTERGTWYADS